MGLTAVGSVAVTIFEACSVAPVCGTLVSIGRLHVLCSSCKSTQPKKMSALPLLPGKHFCAAHTLAGPTCSTADATSATGAGGSSVGSCRAHGAAVAAVADSVKQGLTAIGSVAVAVLESWKCSARAETACTVAGVQGHHTPARHLCCAVNRSAGARVAPSAG